MSDQIKALRAHSKTQDIRKFCTRYTWKICWKPCLNIHLFSNGRQLLATEYKKFTVYDYEQEISTNRLRVHSFKPQSPRSLGSAKQCKSNPDREISWLAFVQKVT